MSSQEAGARALLLEMQIKLANGPHAALGLPPTAGPADVRSAFLQLTKTFHPARFGRMSSEIQRMSNEIFLALRAAHDALAKAPPPVATRPGGRPGSTTAIPTTKPVTRPFGVPVSPATRPGMPQTGRMPAEAKPSDPPTQPPQRQSQPLPITRPGMTPAPVLTRQGSASTPPANRPMGRVPTPATGVPARPTPPSAGTGKTPAPQLTRPSQPGGAIRFPSTPRPTGPTPGTQPIPTVSRASGSTATGVALDRELAPILELMGMGMWDAAQAAIDTLSTKNPANKRYAALACYARGRRAQLEGNLRIAQIELNDALKLDPDLDVAKSAVAELYARRK